MVMTGPFMIRELQHYSHGGLLAVMLTVCILAGCGGEDSPAGPGSSSTLSLAYSAGDGEFGEILKELE